MIEAIDNKNRPAFTGAEVLSQLVELPFQPEGQNVQVVINRGRSSPDATTFERKHEVVQEGRSLGSRPSDVTTTSDIRVIPCCDVFTSMKLLGQQGRFSGTWAPC